MSIDFPDIHMPKTHYNRVIYQLDTNPLTIECMRDEVLLTPPVYRAARVYSSYYRTLWIFPFFGFGLYWQALGLYLFAGTSIPRASCGRTWLYSYLNSLNTLSQSLNRSGFPL